MNSRRAILKLLGVAPAAAGSILVDAPKILAEAGEKPSVADIGMGLLAPPPPGEPLDPFCALLNKLRQDLELECQIKDDIRRIGRFDPDIDALKSISVSSKARMQFERQMEVTNLFHRLNKRIWG